jgi:hypothetical protein
MVSLNFEDSSAFPPYAGQINSKSQCGINFCEDYGNKSLTLARMLHFWMVTGLFISQLLVNCSPNSKNYTRQIVVIFAAYHCKVRFVLQRFIKLMVFI